MTKFEELQQLHQRLLDRMDEVTDQAAFVREVQAYVTRVRDETVDVPAPRDRDQLRANLRYWASYLYDATGTYPNTTMRPSRLTAEPPERVIAPAASAAALPAQKRPAWLIWGVLATIAGVALLVLISALQPMAIPASAILTPEPDWDATATAQPAFAQQTPTPTPFPTNTPEPTPQPTEVLIPTTGGGDGGALVWIAKSAIAGSTAGCGERTVLVTLPTGALDVELSLIGSGEVVARATPDSSQTVVSFDLSQQPSTGSYLLQVTDPDPQSIQLFASVIVYFNADCSRNKQAIEYVEAPEELGSAFAPSYSDPALPLRWYLVTWGPAPSSGSPTDWVAQIVLQAEGGNGYYVYFADNTALPADSSTAQGELCQPISQTVGVTSNGLASSRTVLIMPPFPECIAPQE
jgi:hypothetical protein